MTKTGVAGDAKRVPTASLAELQRRLRLAATREQTGIQFRGRSFETVAEVAARDVRAADVFAGNLSLRSGF
jgi:hypothetical protein